MGKARVYRSGALSGLLVLTTNNKPCWKGMPGTNTLAYFRPSSVKKKKVFKTLKSEEKIVICLLVILLSYALAILIRPSVIKLFGPKLMLLRNKLVRFILTYLEPYRDGAKLVFHSNGYNAKRIKKISIILLSNALAFFFLSVSES